MAKHRSRYLNTKICLPTLIYIKQHSYHFFNYITVWLLHFIIYMNSLWKQQLGNKNHFTSETLKHQIHLTLKKGNSQTPKISTFSLITNMFNDV
jgi:hypothetical protein